MTYSIWDNVFEQVTTFFSFWFVRVFCVGLCCLLLPNLLNLNLNITVYAIYIQFLKNVTTFRTLCPPVFIRCLSIRITYRNSDWNPLSFHRLSLAISRLFVIFSTARFPLSSSIHHPAQRLNSQFLCHQIH